jgi:hypothetical protein
MVQLAAGPSSGAAHDLALQRMATKDDTGATLSRSTTTRAARGTRPWQETAKSSSERRGSKTKSSSARRSSKKSVKEEQQRATQQQEEEQQREAQRVPTSGAGGGAGAAAAAATANEAAAGGCKGPIPKQATAPADAGVLGRLSPFEPTYASAADARREAAVAGLVAKTTDAATSDTTMAAAVGVRGGPSPLEPPSAQPNTTPCAARGTHPWQGSTRSSSERRSCKTRRSSERRGS